MPISMPNPLQDPYTSPLPLGLPSSASGFSYDEQEWDRIRDIDRYCAGLNCYSKKKLKEGCTYSS